MDVLTLLRKEVAESRHRLLPLGVLLIVLPAVFATGPIVFEQTLPENTPVVVVGTEEGSDDDVAIVVAAITASEFGDPIRYQSSSRGFEHLEREQVYAVVEVPDEMGREDASVTIDLHVDGRIAPYRVPSEGIGGALSEMGKERPANVSVERHVIGEETSLSTYLIPVFLMIVLMLLALTYLPYNMSRDQHVIDRLRLASSIEAALATKLAFFTPLAAVTVVTTYAIAGVFDYGLQLPSPSLFGIYLLTFLYTAAIGLSIMLLTDFSIVGRVINVVVFFFVIALSNLVYPAGFFSSWGRDIARSMPTHYSMIIARSHMLKGVDPGTFSDWWGLLGGFTLVTFVVLKLSTEWYKWRA